MAPESKDDRPGAPLSGGASWSEFEQLYRDNHDKLTTYVSRRGFPPADASDIVSTSFANLWKIWQEKERPHDPTPYLYQVVKSRMIDHWRRENRDAARVVAFDAPETAADVASPVEEFTESAEPETGYLQALEMLPKRQRMFLQLDAIGLKDTEIAAALGQSTGHSRPLGAAPTGVPGALAAEAHANRGDAQKEAQSPEQSSQLPPEFEAFYLGREGMYRAYAEAHFGSRETAEEIVHTAFLEILADWTELLSSENLEQGAWAVVRRTVHNRLELERQDPAFTFGPIAQALAATRDKLQTIESRNGLYGAIAELPNRQYEVIVLRYLLGYPTSKVAWYLGIDERTVGHHIRRGRERLRDMLGLGPR